MHEKGPELKKGISYLSCDVSVVLVPVQNGMTKLGFEMFPARKINIAKTTTSISQ